VVRYTPEDQRLNCTKTDRSIDGLIHTYSSWTPCRGEGGRLHQLCGVCVLAPPTEAQRHHQEVHRLLLQPPPHGAYVSLHPTCCHHWLD